MANFALRQPLVVESLRACLVAPKPFCELQGSQKYVFVPALVPSWTAHESSVRVYIAGIMQKLLATTSDLPPFPVQNNDVPAGSGAGSQSGQ